MRAQRLSSDLNCPSRAVVYQHHGLQHRSSEQYLVVLSAGGQLHTHEPAILDVPQRSDADVPEVHVELLFAANS